MQPLLIVKTGSTIDHLRCRRGDFEDWVRTGLALQDETVHILDVRTSDVLPDPQGYAGVVVTGSHAMVTDHWPWSERAAEWLLTAVEQDIPLLGICYGHQLLAYALGGEVGHNPRGGQYGTVPIQLRPTAQTDKLLSALAGGMRVQVSHSQCVLRLPSRAIPLASTPTDPHAAFVASQCAWGVQFHPEFDAEISKAYIRSHASELRAEGQEPDALLNTCEDTPAGTRLLHRFMDIVRAH